MGIVKRQLLKWYLLDVRVWSNAQIYFGCAHRQLNGVKGASIVPYLTCGRGIRLTSEADRLLMRQCCWCWCPSNARCMGRRS